MNFKILFVIVFSITIGSVANSQTNLGEKLQGYIITNSGEKIEGFIKERGILKNQNKIEFYKNLNESSFTKYKPNDIWGFNILGKNYQSIPVKGFSKKKKAFLEITVEGKITVYVYYYTASSNETGFGGSKNEITVAKKGNTSVILDLDGTEIVSEYIAIKNETDRLELSAPKTILSFKKVMSKYLSDYAQLSEKIRNKAKGYRIQNAFSIIEEYNNHFSEN